MKPLWSKLKAFNLNTVLGAVTWDQVEPVEGQFDFGQLDEFVKDARSHGLKLIVLWFGAFKNGMSSYAPAWVKTYPSRFPRVKINTEKNGLEQIEVLSIMDHNLKEADSKAFAALMKHLKEIDGDDKTVIIVQCQNEVGILGDSMDRSESSMKIFNDVVPIEVVEFVKNNWENLHYTFRDNFKGLELRSRGNWIETFGSGAKTEELFMAYMYAKFINYVAARGRREYNIPIYTNVWQNDTAPAGVAAGGGAPGQYPSGGAVARVLDIWLEFAPDLDWISPDIYLNDYEERCQ